MVFFGIILSLVIFTAIVLIHEYGHFKAARTFGVKVEEFGIGIPPRAMKLWRDKAGTLFSLNWIPLGGFVRLKGEQISTPQVYSQKGKLLNEEKILGAKVFFDRSGKEYSSLEVRDIVSNLKHTQEKDNLSQKPYWQQSIIILAGVTMNFILSFLIFFGLFLYGVSPIGINDKIPTQTKSLLIPTYEQAIDKGILTVGSGVLVFPATGSLSEEAGLKQGDIILAIDAQPIYFGGIREVFSQNKQKEINLLVSRKKKELSIKITPNSEGKIGSYIAENISYNKEFSYKYGLLDAAKYASFEVYYQSILTLQAMKHIFGKILFPETPTERTEGVESLSGPIGITSVITQGFTLGLSFLLIITALISLNLGVFNLLPIPALDGGRFLFICIHAFLGLFSKKKIFSSVLENSIHVIFFIILIVFSIFIAYNDIVRLFQ